MTVDQAVASFVPRDAVALRPPLGANGHTDGSKPPGMPLCKRICGSEDMMTRFSRKYVTSRKSTVTQGSVGPVGGGMIVSVAVAVVGT